ncbi:MAG TPA: amidohydrolase family protein [Terriglobales bacterium]|jgi:L-fuconolactonase|nr:amidohydrolase family protein [Terriglobales bacterium]
MRIDSHQHFWRYDPVRDGWITQEMAVLKRDFMPEELSERMRESGVDCSIAVQTDQSETETHFLLDLAAKNSAIAGVVGWVNLLDKNVEQRLEQFSRNPKLRGFRHIVQAEPDDRFLMRDDFLRGIRALPRHDFTYDILVYARQLPAAVEFVKRFPAQKFVVDHLAKPSVKSGEIDAWARNIRDLAKSPNVYCKLSGLVTEADWASWNAETLRPYLDVVFEAFGTDRLMFGSDWPVCLLAASYAQVKEVIENYTRDLSADEKARIFGLNAARFYGLAA